MSTDEQMLLAFINKQTNADEIKHVIMTTPVNQLRKVSYFYPVANELSKMGYLFDSDGCKRVLRLLLYEIQTETSTSWSDQLPEEARRDLLDEYEMVRAFRQRQ